MYYTFEYTLKIDGSSESADIQRDDVIDLFFKFVMITVDVTTNALTNLANTSSAFSPARRLRCWQTFVIRYKNSDNRYHICYIDLYGTAYKSTKVDCKTNTQSHGSAQSNSKSIVYLHQCISSNLHFACASYQTVYSGKNWHPLELTEKHECSSKKTEKYAT